MAHPKRESHEMSMYRIRQLNITQARQGFPRLVADVASTTEGEEVIALISKRGRVQAALISSQAFRQYLRWKLEEIAREGGREAEVGEYAHIFLGGLPEEEVIACVERNYQLDPEAARAIVERAARERKRNRNAE